SRDWSSDVCSSDLQEDTGVTEADDADEVKDDGKPCVTAGNEIDYGNADAGGDEKEEGDVQAGHGALEQVGAAAGEFELLDEYGGISGFAVAVILADAGLDGVTDVPGAGDGAAEPLGGGQDQGAAGHDEHHGGDHG